MNATHWLETIAQTFRHHQGMCEAAASRVDDRQFFTALGPEENSIAIQMKHLAGNHHSRWRDFLTTDGEKRDRDRDSEFIVEGDTRQSIEGRWRTGWQVLYTSLEALEPPDLERTVTIRGEPMSVVEAVQRSSAHASYHSGQIVQLARHLVGPSWQSLSVPLGKTREHNDAMRAKYGGDWWSSEKDS